MTVGSIINNVRWSLDEEKGQSDYESTYMDNIIKAKINDALMWVMFNADSSLLDGSDESDGTSGVVQEEFPAAEGVTNKATYKDGFITMPTSPYSFLRLLRVKVSTWARAIHTAISDDSEEYLMQSDDIAKADVSRPQAALVSTFPNKIELFPKPEDGDTIVVTYCIVPTNLTSTMDEETAIGIPPKLKTAFIYYLAYLVEIAYENTTKASSMLATAKMNAGISTSSS